MSLLLAASDTASKVPFYICGGALAVWAVALAAIGLSRPEFPGNATRRTRRDRDQLRADRAGDRRRDPHLLNSRVRRRRVRIDAFRG